MLFGDRLIEVREKLGFNQVNFSEKIELAAQSLARYEKNKVIPSMEFITKLTNMFSINSNWLLTGKGEMFLNENQNNQPPQTAPQNNYQIEVLNVKASAGFGIENELVEVVDTILLDKSLFKTPINPAKVKLIEVVGDSMYHTIKDGDYVIIDETKAYGVDGIYAINLHNQLLIKRLKFRLDGTIAIISDNKDYETEIYNPNESQIPLTIIGLRILTIQR